LSHLQPLALDDVNKMVADVLHYSHAPQEVLVLSTLVFEKTKGNPFFAISFLTKLYQTGLIVHLSAAPLASSPHAALISVPLAK
jgi:predicted ATPase